VDILIRILITLGLVAANAYFVAAEFSAVSARLTRLQTEAGVSLFSRLALRIKQRLDLYLSACQLGVTLASLGLGAVTEPAVAVVISPVLKLFSLSEHSMHVVSFVVAMGISTSLHIIAGEQAPKTWAIVSADRLLKLLALPLVMFTYLFYPAIWLLNAASNGLLRLTGAPLSVLRRVVALESAVPLLIIALISIGVGFLSAGMFLRSQLSQPLVAPSAGYYGVVVLGVAASLGLIASTLPVLRRITGPETARNE